MHNKALAEKYLKKAFELHLLGDINEAMINYKISINFYPTTEAHTYLGWAHSMNGDFEKAISECENAIEIDGDFGNPYNNIGSYLVKLGREEEAVSWFEKAIEAPRFDPKHLAYYNLGKIFRRQGEWTKAVEMFKEAYKINPQFKAAKNELFRLMAYMN